MIYRHGRRRPDGQTPAGPAGPGQVRATRGASIINNSLISDVLWFDVD
jgi:hypothetical protein